MTSLVWKLTRATGRFRARYQLRMSTGVNFHTRLVIALGVAWILDGLEISVASAIEGALTKPEVLNFSRTPPPGSPRST